jgi:hypothetical protein
VVVVVELAHTRQQKVSQEQPTRVAVVAVHEMAVERTVDLEWSSFGSQIL